MTPTDDPKQNPSDKILDFQDYRLRLVTILFGLSLTELARQSYGIIDRHFHDKQGISHTAASVSQLLMAFCIIISSWFGWHKSLKGAESKNEDLVKLLAILDLAMVFCYFGLVYTIELPERNISYFPEFMIFILIVALYLIYDICSKLPSTEDWKWPWPSATTLLWGVSLYFVATVQFGPSPTAAQVVAINTVLTLLIIWYFRSTKNYQAKLLKDKKANKTVPRRHARGRAGVCEIISTTWTFVNKPAVVVPAIVILSGAAYCLAQHITQPPPPHPPPQGMPKPHICPPPSHTSSPTP